MKSIAYAVALCFALVGCSDNNAGTDYNYASGPDNLVAPAATPQVPAHRYDFKEGFTYGYIAAVSEEDQKKGKAAGDVVMYTYHGNDGGVHRLKSVDANGAEIARYECSTPCVAIKAHMGRSLERVAYNPGSVIGSAFQDAMNGHLEQVREPKTPAAAPFVPSAWAGEYKGAFEGNATGSVTVKDQQDGLTIDIGVGHERCSGGVEFIAPRPAGNVVVKRFPVDDSGKQCVLTLTRDGKRLRVEEQSCGYYHGAECSFNGEADR